MKKKNRARPRKQTHTAHIVIVHMRAIEAQVKYIELFRTAKQFQSYLVAFRFRKYFSYYRFITKKKTRSGSLLVSNKGIEQQKKNYRIFFCVEKFLHVIWREFEQLNTNRFNCKRFFLRLTLITQNSGFYSIAAANIWPINLLMLKNFAALFLFTRNQRLQSFEHIFCMRLAD